MLRFLSGAGHYPVS